MASIQEIQSAITDEIFFALGLKRRGVLRKSLGWLFSLPTKKFAHMMAAVDQAIKAGGPPAGCQKMMDLLNIRVQALGRSHIPVAGPAIILSNHPGAYDSMAIGSLIPRRDLKAIVYKTRLYQVLPHMHSNLMYVSDDPKENMVALRQAVSYLRQGGILLQFGSGLIEPDPANHMIGDEVFEQWSPSLEILLRKAPETQVVPTIASGVLLKNFEGNPLIKLRRNAMDRRRLAEFIQIIQQLMFPKSVQAFPRISFGERFTLDEVAKANSDRTFMPGVIEKVKEHLADHLEWKI